MLSLLEGTLSDVSTCKSVDNGVVLSDLLSKRDAYRAATDYGDAGDGLIGAHQSLRRQNRNFPRHQCSLQDEQSRQSVAWTTEL